MDGEEASKSKAELTDKLENFISDSGIPEEDQPEVKKMIAMSLRMGAAASPQVEIMKKVTPEHITQMLRSQEAESQRRYAEKREKKRFYLVWLLIVCAFVLAVIWLLKDHPETLEKVLYAAGGLIAGAVGGYGYGKSARNDED